MVGLAIPKRWILFVAALGLISALVATSRNEWASAAGTLPDAPASISAVAGDAQVTVSWTAPASPGQSTPPGGTTLEDIAIVNYSVTCASSAETKTADTTSLSHTFTGLTNGDAYTCDVVVNTAAGTGPAATAPAVTPAAPTLLLTSLTTNVSSASVALGSSTVFVADATASDGSAAPDTTIAWSVGSGGSPSSATGGSLTYSAVGSGIVTIGITATQSTTAITKTAIITVTNFTPPPQPTPVPPVSNPVTPKPTPPPKPTDQSDVVVIEPESSAQVEAKVGEGDAGFDVPATYDIDLPAQSVSDYFVLIAKPVTKTEAEGFAALPETHRLTSIPPLEVQITDAAGQTVDRLNLNQAYTIKMTVSKAQLDALGLNPASLEILKAKDPVAGPFTPLATTFKLLSNGDVEFSGSGTSFSTFVMGSQVAAGAPAAPTPVPTATPTPALPSTGDVAPSATQVIGLLALGIILAAGGAVYLRRQRRVARTG